MRNLGTIRKERQYGLGSRDPWRIGVILHNYAPMLRCPVWGLLKHGYLDISYANHKLQTVKPLRSLQSKERSIAHLRIANKRFLWAISQYTDNYCGSI